MTDYALAISGEEIRRYQLMAERAQVAEAELWAQAGIGPGATVVDVGCGPAAMAVLLGRTVGPSGRVIGVERDDPARQAGRQLVAASGVANVELQPGLATETGLEPGGADVVMCRHVLAHNGRDEQRIVDHLAELCRPGGVVYLVDIDGTAIRLVDVDPDLDDLNERYVEFHRSLGNDLQTGLRLRRLLATAGLDVVAYEGHYTIIAAPPGLRPPPWAARDAMVAAGVATDDDVRRWQAAFERMDTAPVRPTVFAPHFIALGRTAG